MRRFLPVFASILLFFPARAQDRCEVVFLADFIYANNPAWISAVKSWGATGVNLRVFRSEVESSYRRYDFRFMRGCVRRLAASDLDIHIRVSMGIVRPSWAGRYTRDDFHLTKGGLLVDNYNFGTPGMPTLNLTSERARGDLLRFFAAVIRELGRQPRAVRERIVVVMPTMGPDDETEYPAAVHRSGPLADQGWWGWLTGYSEPEQRAFVKYLRAKYNGRPDDPDAARLNVAWGAAFGTIDRTTIRIDEYDWERLRDRYDSFPEGRRDFLEFRAAELKRFIDSCASIAHEGGFRFGIQFGALHDAGVEFRGVWDVTPLAEHADLVISDDVPEHTTSFWYSADLLRTVCRFWSAEWRRRGVRAPVKRFGTETNWPGYNEIVADDLVEGWGAQLNDWYNRGGSVLYLSHWGTVDEIVSWPGRGRTRGARRIADVVMHGGLDGYQGRSGGFPYAAWRSALRSFAGRTPRQVVAATAIETDPMSSLAGAPGLVGRATPRVVGSLRGYADSARIPMIEYPSISRLRQRLIIGRGEDGVGGPVDILTPSMKGPTVADSAEYRRIIR